MSREDENGWAGWAGSRLIGSLFHEHLVLAAGWNICSGAILADFYTLSAIGLVMEVVWASRPHHAPSCQGQTDWSSISALKLDWRSTMSSSRTGILFLFRFHSEQDQDVWDSRGDPDRRLDVQDTCFHCDFSVGPSLSGFDFGLELDN